MQQPTATAMRTGIECWSKAVARGRERSNENVQRPVGSKQRCRVPASARADCTAGGKLQEHGAQNNRDTDAPTGSANKVKGAQAAQYANQESGRGATITRRKTGKRNARGTERQDKRKNGRPHIRDWAAQGTEQRKQGGWKGEPTRRAGTKARRGVRTVKRESQPNKKGGSDGRRTKRKLKDTRNERVHGSPKTGAKADRTKKERGKRGENAKKHRTPPRLFSSAAFIS